MIKKLKFYSLMPIAFICVLFSGTGFANHSVPLSVGEDYLGLGKIVFKQTSPTTGTLTCEFPPAASDAFCQFTNGNCGFNRQCSVSGNNSSFTYFVRVRKNNTNVDFGKICVNFGSPTDPCTYEGQFDDPNIQGFFTGNYFIPMDIDGDGDDDMVVKTDEGKWEVQTTQKDPSTGHHRFRYSHEFGPYVGEIYTASTYNSGNHFFHMDIDHDGDDDLLVRETNGTFVVLETKKYSIYNNQYGFRTNGMVYNSVFSDENGWDSENKFFPIDWDDDGYSDELLVRFDNGQIQILEFTNGNISAKQFTSPSDIAGSEFTNGNHFYPSKVKGTAQERLLVRLSNGQWLAKGHSLSGLTASPTYSISGIQFANSNGWDIGNRFYSMDLDGDGQDELVVRWATGGIEVRKTDYNNTSNFLVWQYGFMTRFRDDDGWCSVASYALEC